MRFSTFCVRSLACCRAAPAAGGSPPPAWHGRGAWQRPSWREARRCGGSRRRVRCPPPPRPPHRRRPARRRAAPPRSPSGSQVREDERDVGRGAQRAGQVQRRPVLVDGQLRPSPPLRRPAGQQPRPGPEHRVAEAHRPDPELAVGTLDPVDVAGADRGHGGLQLATSHAPVRPRVGGDVVGGQRLLEQPRHPFGSASGVQRERQQRR
jgi:hypothetical protein